MSSDHIRSFISIDLDDPHVQSQLEEVTSSLQGIGADLKPVARENVHITIKFLGSVDKAKLEAVKRSLGQIQFQRFALEVRGTGVFPNMRHIGVVWIGLGEGWAKVEQIYEQTESQLSTLGFPRESRGFSPHVTIARVRTARRQDELANFLQKLSEKDFGVIDVKALRLKQSVLHPSGPTYSTLYETAAEP